MSRFLQVLAILALPCLALSRQALAMPCTEVFLDCGRGEENAFFKNLKQLRTERRSDRWIARNCRPEFVEPGGCDWRRAGTANASSTSTTVVVPRPVGTPARDPKGKLGPTPAPERTDSAGLGVAPVRPANVALPSGTPFAAEIEAAALRYRLPGHLLRAVLQVESGGNALAVSHKGAVGLMQLLPTTAQAMGVTDLNDPAQNIAGGARFLRVLANRFDGDLVKVLSAYHAGSTRVQGRDATPFAATDDYVRKILRLYYQYRDQAAPVRDAAARRSPG